MGIFSSYKRDDTTSGAADQPLLTEEGAEAPKVKGKGAPTPTRKEAEAARMQRLHPKLTEKERKALESQRRREARDNAYSRVENHPIRVLLRDHIDSRWHVGEFLMPTMIILLAVMFGATAYPQVFAIVSYVMWALLLMTLVDVWMTWRAFKRLVKERMPENDTKESYRGLVMYALNRCIQIRRFRVPPPRIKRGDTF